MNSLSTTQIKLSNSYKVSKAKGVWGYEDYFQVKCDFYTDGRTITSIESVAVGPIPGKLAFCNIDTMDEYYLDNRRTYAVKCYGNAITGLTNLGRIKMYAEFYCSEY